MFKGKHITQAWVRNAKRGLKLPFKALEPQFYRRQ